MSQSSSIVRKVTMSLSGLFLITFLPMHLLINSLSLIGADLFNEAVHFMETNLMIQVMQPVLGIGFIVHIVMGIKLTMQNRAARPIKYEFEDAADSSTWASRNMILTGLLLLAFLALHLANYFVKMKFTGMDGMTAFEMVTGLFDSWYYVAIYEAAFILLGVHLSHGFTSAFQSIGANHSKYNPIIQMGSQGYVIVITLGFVIIPILHFIGAAPFCSGICTH